MLKLIQWMEIRFYGNNFPNEEGANVYVKRHLFPDIWWYRNGAERTVGNGLALFKTFLWARLPPFWTEDYQGITQHWFPMKQTSGAPWFVYVPPLRHTLKKALNVMLVALYMRRKRGNRVTIPERTFLNFLETTHSYEFELGAYLTDEEREEVCAVLHTSYL